MLPGFDGHLISEFYLERRLTTATTDGRDEMAERGRRSLREWRRRCAMLGPASSLRAMLDIGALPLTTLLGFPSATAIAPARHSIAGTLPGAAAIVVTTWGERLDAFWRLAVTEAWDRAVSWSLLFNGVAIRLVDAHTLYARRYLEFDLDLAASERRTFEAFWSLMRADVIGHPTRLAAIISDSDRHAAGVCRSLRDGVLTASGEVFGALAAPSMRRRPSRTTGVEPADAFEQALTIVYRVLFLLFAEARGLVPLWHPVYRESYSLEALSHDVVRDASAAGSWDTLRAIGRLAHAGCRAGDLRVTPFNGRLFAPGRTPLAERRDLNDAAARRAVLALSTHPSPDGAGRERIEYRDLGVEQLGAVYERLLDYTPRIERRSTGPATISLERGSGLRKETGTFYTPRPVADYLVRRTLSPLTLDASPEQILRLRVLDPAMGSGAFLVSACRFLAAAYEQALVQRGGCHPSDIGEHERAGMRRTIAERCLYGVDLNPMAVQLARLSLWLATLAAERPLTFLDHRLRSGDSLLGARLSTLRHSPSLAPRRRRADAMHRPSLFDDDTLRDLIANVLPARFELESLPDDTVDQVRLKEQMHAAMNARDSTLSRWRRVADLWCAAWFATSRSELPTSAFAALSDAILTGHGTLPARATGAYLDAADRLSQRWRYFHWELEFPEVFFDAGGRRRLDGGFDAVIGNPPWDMVRADRGPADARLRGRAEAAAVVRFTRDAGIYASQSDGHANRYQMFVERAIDLTRPGGRLGLVVPSGLATDSGSARLRKRLLTSCNLDSLVGFDNRRGAFPIHRSVRFLLATATAGSPTHATACRFGECDVSALEAAEADEASWFPIQITPALLERVSGDNLAIPWVLDSTDLAILERTAALFPPLGGVDGWAARFGRELNATDDRDAFRIGRPGLPVVEGRQLEPFRVDVASSKYTIGTGELRQRLRDRRYDAPRLAYRDVASATNRLTLIAAVLPAGCVSTHTVFCLRTRLSQARQHLLCGLFNSYVLNYLVRLRVSTHVTTGIVERLPVPRAERAPRACREIAALARCLARRSDPQAMATLQARAAALYQLTRHEFAHVLETFPLIPREERDKALSIFSSGMSRMNG